MPETPAGSILPTIRNMSDVLLVAGTVLGGIVVFIVGQVFVVLFAERIRLQARTVEEIAVALLRYSRDYTNPIQMDQITDEQRAFLLTAQDELRTLAARLRASALTLRWYRFFERVRLVLPRDNVIEASRGLIGLSNSLPPHPAGGIDGAERFRREVEAFLGIEIPPPDPPPDAETG